jgi:aminopeptidase N
MTRDAEMSAGDFVSLVIRGLAEETDDTAVKQLPVYVQIAIEQFSHPAKRDALRARWEEGFWKLLEAAAPGSDHQLTYLKCFAGTTGKRIPPSSYSGAGRSPKAMDFLAGLLDGSARLEGFTVDTDMRWTILTALASAGRVDRARIDEELAADNTISGHEKAAAAIAALPDAASKEQSWLDGAIRKGVPNETQRHIAYIWDVAGQRDALAPYLEKYLAAADTLWEDRGVQIASTALEYMFPRALTSQETLERVDAWLETSAANPAAKRYVGEGRADIVRALKAQAFDAD